MSGFLDTTIIVRYLTGDPAPMAKIAATIVDSQESLWLTETAIAETAFVLSRNYRITRTDVVEALSGFIQKENISVFGFEKSDVLQALLLCQPSRRVSFADALIWCSAKANYPGVVYTFDNRFPSGGIEIRRAAPRP